MNEVSVETFAGKAQLQSLAKRRFRTVTIRTSGRESQLVFRIQSFTEGEQSAIEALRIDEQTGRLSRDGIGEMRRMAIATALVDHLGRRIYSDAQAGELAEVDSAVTEALWEAINAHCNLSPSQEEAKAAAKN